MKKFAITILGLCLAVSAAGVYLGYSYMADTDGETEAVEVYHPEHYQDLVQERILTTTKIVYLHYDKTNGQTSEYSHMAPTFMLNRTRDELAQIFNQWEILSFASDEVIMQRTVESLPPVAYTLSTQGEFIAIYRGLKENGNIIELTTIPVSHLPEQEQINLARGIAVADRNELIRRLEDFSS